MNHQQQIENYLEGKLSPDELLAFEKQLAENISLKKDVEMEQAARVVIQVGGRTLLKEQLEEFEEELETPIRKIFPYRRWVVAATVLALFTAGFWFFQNMDKNDPERIFADNFETYRNPIVVRSGENLVKETWENAILNYATGDYKKAAINFRLSLKDTATISYLGNFYLGLSLLSQENADALAAIESFDKTLLSDNDYRQQAMWYKALALVKLEKKEEAISALKKLINAGEYKKMEAEKLIKVLN